MAEVSSHRSPKDSEQDAAGASGDVHALQDSAGRESGAIEDGIVSSTADPDEGIEYGGGKTVPPGDAEPEIPPYEGRTTSTEGGTPGRGDAEVSANTGVATGDSESKGPQPGAGSGDPGAGVTHVAGTGRAEDKR
jgi:hypothetical protein